MAHEHLQIPITQQPAEEAATLHLQPRSGEMHAADALQMNTADFINKEGGILASARTPWGSPAARITDASVVRVHGQETSVAAAVVLGLLERTADGGYRETGRDLNAEPEKSPAPTPLTPLSAAGAAARAQLQTIPFAALNRAIETVITKGRAAVHDEDVARMADSDSAALSASLSSAVEGLQQQADAALRSMGINPQHFYEVARARWGDELRDAMRRHFHTADPTAYVALADRYTREVPPDTESIRAAYPTFTDPRTGTEMVTINGVTVSVAAAAKAGVI